MLVQVNKLRLLQGLHWAYTTRYNESPILCWPVSLFLSFQPSFFLCIYTNHLSNAHTGGFMYAYQERICQYYDLPLIFIGIWDSSFK